MRSMRAFAARLSWNCRETLGQLDGRRVTLTEFLDVSYHISRNHMILNISEIDVFFKQKKFPT